MLSKYLKEELAGAIDKQLQNNVMLFKMIIIPLRN